MGKFSHCLTQNLQVCHDDYLEKVTVFFYIKCIPAQGSISFFLFARSHRLMHSY